MSSFTPLKKANFLLREFFCNIPKFNQIFFVTKKYSSSTVSPSHQFAVYGLKKKASFTAEIFASPYCWKNG
jgi:hypothetical protein